METPPAGDRAGALTCKVCVRRSARYTCPRCSINYCSLACYRDRRHGKCSERFYRECCENAIKNLSADDEKYQQVKRMILQSDNFEEFDGMNHEPESSDEGSSVDDPADLSERCDLC